MKEHSLDYVIILYYSFLHNQLNEPLPSQGPPTSVGVKILILLSFYSL